MQKFGIQGKSFVLNGEPYQVRSGAIHYFRVPRAYWRDRLQKLYECGFNTVETYLAWNVHERKEGVFDFEGERDFGAFLDIAAEIGLTAIVRAGPFICAEWEMGGLPSWLLRDPSIVLRTSDPVYLEKVGRYVAAIADVLRPRLVERGGNVIMLAIENEYGSYSSDKAYLNALKEMYLENGLDGCLFVTADGPGEGLFTHGGIEGCLNTATFGSRTEERMAILKKFIGDKPAMCMEFWDGWFDQWYDEHHTRTTEEICRDFEPFLKHNDSFNFYMFHGGTNFGFMNGATVIVPDGGDPERDHEAYRANVTSYDYDAIVSESGDRRPAYYAVRDLIARYCGSVPPLTATDSVKKAYGEVRFTGVADLFDNLGVFPNRKESVFPLTMEKMGQDYGYILYTAELDFPVESELRITRLADRALVYVDGEFQGMRERGRPFEKCLTVKSSRKGAELQVLVENMGRVNFGPYIHERKGVGAIKLYEYQTAGWTNISMPMEDELKNLSYRPIGGARDPRRPAFWRGTFTVNGAEDTFFRPSGFGKGFVVVNGRNIGRYYNAAGPQKTLYLPKCFLREGENEVIVFDSDGCPAAPQASLTDAPEL